MSASITFTAESVEKLKELISNFNIKDSNVVIENYIGEEKVDVVHPYTQLLEYSVKSNVWRQFELANGMYARQIPYKEIVKVLKHMVSGNVDVIGGVSIEKVKNYFKSQGYTTATKYRVSTDELIGRFRESTLSAT